MSMRKIASLLLALVLVLPMIPFGAMAAEDAVYVTVGSTTTGYATLEEAIGASGADTAFASGGNEASENENAVIEIRLAKNCAISQPITFRRNVRLYAEQGSQVTLTSEVSTDASQILILGTTMPEVVIENITIEGGTVGTTSGKALLTVRDGATLTLNNVTVNANAAYAVFLVCAGESAQDPSVTGAKNDQTQLIINSGSFNGYANTHIVNLSRGNVTVNGGTFSANGSGSCLYQNSSAGVLTVNGGAFRSVKGHGLYHHGMGTTVINGGSFAVDNMTNADSHVGRAIKCDAAGKVIVNGGTFTQAAKGPTSNTNPTIIESGSTVEFSKGCMEVYGGTFQSATSEMIFNFVDSQTTEEGSATKLYFYNGTVIATKNATSGSFAIRTRKGASATVYGGTFVSKGTLLGCGTSSEAGGYIYVFGGTFVKNATGGYDTVDFNGSDKNIWLYGGTYLSQKTEDSNIVTGSKEVSSNTVIVNKAHSSVTVSATSVSSISYQDINGATQTVSDIKTANTISYNLPATGLAATFTFPNGKTYGTDNVYRMLDRLVQPNSIVELKNADASTTFSTRNVAITVKGTNELNVAHKVSVRNGNALFADTQFAQAKDNETSLALRLVREINAELAANYDTFGYAVSITNKTPTLGAQKVASTGTTKLYNSVVADEETISATYGYKWLALGIDDIPLANYGTSIYIRPYAQKGNETVYGDVVELNALQIADLRTLEVSDVMSYTKIEAFPNIEDATYSQVQGGTTDGTYFYFVVVSAHADDNAKVAKLVKVDPTNWSIVKTLTNLKLGHANDMVYDSKNDRLIAIHMGKTVSIFTTDLVLEETFDTATEGFSGIAYSATRNQYAVGQSGRYNVDILDDEFNFAMRIRGQWGKTKQGMTADEHYIYYLHSATQKTYIKVYTWEGEYVRTFELDITIEGENLFWYQGQLYICCNNGSGATVLYRANFQAIS